MELGLSNKIYFMDTLKTFLYMYSVYAFISIYIITVELKGTHTRPKVSALHDTSFQGGFKERRISILLHHSSGQVALLAKLVIPIV